MGGGERLRRLHVTRTLGTLTGGNLTGGILILLYLTNPFTPRSDRSSRNTNAEAMSRRCRLLKTRSLSHHHGKLGGSTSVD